MDNAQAGVPFVPVDFLHSENNKHTLQLAIVSDSSPSLTLFLHLNCCTFSITLHHVAAKWVATAKCVVTQCVVTQCVMSLFVHWVLPCIAQVFLGI